MSTSRAVQLRMTAEEFDRLQIETAVEILILAKTMPELAAITRTYPPTSRRAIARMMTSVLSCLYRHPWLWEELSQSERAAATDAVRELKGT